MVDKGDQMPWKPEQTSRVASAPGHKGAINDIKQRMAQREDVNVYIPANFSITACFMVRTI
jgi:hypothetical protein